MTVTFTNEPVDQALDRLSEMTGISVVLDIRVQDKASNAKITTNLNGVCLDTAVRMLADMAGLEAVSFESAIYVTSSENAQRLKKEERRAETPQTPIARPGAP